MHTRLRDEITNLLADNLHVGVNEVTNGLYLSLELRVHGADGITRRLLRNEKINTSYATNLSIGVAQIRFKKVMGKVCFKTRGVIWQK